MSYANSITELLGITNVSIGNDKEWENNFTIEIYTKQSISAARIAKLKTHGYMDIVFSELKTCRFERSQFFYF